MEDTLPRDEDGFIIDAAIFGEAYAVRITYNTDPDGKWVEMDDYENQTLHGLFETKEEAKLWLQEARPDDTDIKDMDIIVINKVRP